MIEVLRKRAPILTFGVFQIFFTAPGQTFLISLFIGPIFNDLGVSASWFAGAYSLATFLASLMLQPCGRLLDRFSVKPILLGMILLMSLGCLLIGSAQSLWVLFIGFFLVRFIGQGAFGLAASTLVTKQFQKNRGKALSVIMMGFPLSEMIYPFIAVAMISEFGWRMAYYGFAASFLIMVPLQFFLLSRSHIKHGHFYPEEARVQAQAPLSESAEHHLKDHDYTLSETLRDPSFYFTLTASTIPPIVMTGLFFHQSSLFELHGWDLSLAAPALFVYAIVKAVGAIGIGPFIDKYGSAPFFILMITLMAAGTFVAANGGPAWTIILYLSLLGFALGLSAPVMSHLWASLYGTAHIGSIKGFIGTFRNGLTGFGPLPLAIAMEAGYSLSTLLLIVSATIALLVLIPIGLFLFDPRLKGADV